MPGRKRKASIASSSDGATAHHAPKRNQAAKSYGFASLIASPASQSNAAEKVIDAALQSVAADNEADEEFIPLTSFGDDDDVEPDAPGIAEMLAPAIVTSKSQEKPKQSANNNETRQRSARKTRRAGRSVLSTPATPTATADAVDDENETGVDMTDVHASSPPPAPVSVQTITSSAMKRQTPTAVEASFSATNFTDRSDKVQCSTDAAKIQLDAGESICFQGHIAIRVLSGAVHVHGARLKETSHFQLLHAPLRLGSSPQPLRIEANQSATILLRSSDSNAESVAEDCWKSCNLHEISIPNFTVNPAMHTSRPLHFPSSWYTAYTRPTNSTVTLLCGERNSGKSTFARFLVNQVLNEFEAVAFLETDVGQTELTPPGQISLHVVRKPLLGPPSTHLQQPEISFYFGSTTPSTDPDYYIRCVSLCLDRYRALEMPLIVNTHGWVKALGLELIQSIADRAHPTRVLQLQSSGQISQVTVAEASSDSEVESDRDEVDDEPVEPSDSFAPLLTTYSGISTLVPRAVDSSAVSKTTSSASSLRARALLAHLTALSPAALDQADHDSGNIASVLAARLPYRVPFSSVEAQFLHHDVAASHASHALDGALVALCSVRGSKPVNSTVADIRVGSYDLQHPPRCLGMGFIRSIDYHRRELLIVTSVPFELLLHVNALVKAPASQLDLPSHALRLVHHCHADGAPTAHFSGHVFSGAAADTASTRKNVGRARLG